MSKERLNELGFILLSAGSDEGFLNLNRPDTLLLGLDTNREMVEITEQPSRTMGYIPSDPPGEPIKKKVKAVEAQVINPDDEFEVPRVFRVNVGVARQAHKKLMGGRKLEGLRQPDAVNPVVAEPEPASV